MKRARLSPLVPQTPKAVSPSKPPLGSPWQGKTWPESRTCRPLSSWSTRPGLSHVWGHTLSWPWGSREGLSLTASRLPQCDLCLRTKHPLSPQKKLLEAPGPPAAPSPACPGCCCREMCLGRSVEESPFSQCFSKSLWFPHSLLTSTAATAELVPMRFPT